MCDSYRTYGLLTDLCLPLLRDFLMAVTFSDTNTYSAVTRLFVLVFRLFGRVVSILMYISALHCALGTLSEFSSVPILVADELVLPFLVNHDPRVNTLYRIHLSLERLPCSRDLVIRVTTTRNIRTRFRTIEQTGSRPNHSRRLRSRKGVPHRDIPPITTTTNASHAILPHYVLYRTKHRTRIPPSPVGLPQSSVDTPERSSRTT